MNLMETGIKYGLKKVIFASTGGAIYGEQEQFPAPETHPCQPLSPYGITKLATEKYLSYYREIHNIPNIVLRYANVYGPRQNPHGEAGVVAIFCSRFLQNEEAIIYGDGRQSRDFVYVSDVVRANLEALDYSSSEIFNIGTGLETDINSIFQTLKAVSGSSQPETHAPVKTGEQLRSVIDIAKAKRLLGWSPQISLDEGLERTFNFFKDRQL